MNLIEKFFTKTASYRAVIRDKEQGKLSHSYLLVCQDEAYLRGYVKALAKVIMCEKGGFYSLFKIWLLIIFSKSYF